MRPRQIFLLAYLASGAAGLLYEVAWARLLTLYLGHSTAAVSTVLAAFMGGLAAGAALGGRFAPRLPAAKALRGYAGLEIGVALLALLLPASLQAARPILAAAYDPAQAGGLAFVLTRLAASVSIIALPAALMGATFPLAVRWYVRSPERAGRETGVLYALNTVGAATGAAFTGFVLLPQLGLRGTTMVGVALNAIAAGVAWWVARREPLEAPDAAPASPAARKAARRQARAKATSFAPRPLAATVALALSGFIALTYEVAWTRLLALVIGPTTYAFGLMLAAFIAGLAIGAMLGARWATSDNPMAGLGATFVGTAIGGLLVAATASTFPLRVAEMVTRPHATFASVMWIETASLVALLLPTTIALGAAFPIAVAAATGPGRAVAKDAALVYAGNTLGAIAGSLASGFLLIPWLGLRTTIVSAAIAAAAGGAVIVLISQASRRLRFTVITLGAAAVAAAIALPGWNRALLSSGAYKYAPYMRSADLETALEAGTLLYYAEGATGTVTVRRAAGMVSLAIDGKVDASNTGDMLTQKLLGHLPLLLHQAPKRAGIIGLGSGVTLGAVLRHPVERADVIEISREVVEASAFFKKENLDALQDPRTRLILGDARTHLTLGSGQYDVIISEPSNPWMAGVASLFTQEFFETLRARLAPGGIVCQWAHTYDISESDLRSIVATFLAAFPNGSLWLIGDSDVLLISNEGPIESLLPRMTSAWTRPGVAADLATVQVKSPFELVTQLVAAGPGLASFAAGALIQTDDRMALEFSAPRGIVGAMRLDNATRLREVAAKSAPEPVRRALETARVADWKQRGLMLLAAESLHSSYDDLAKAASLDPGDRETLEALEAAAAGSGRIDQALALMERLARQPGGTISARLALARLLASTGRGDEALRVVEEALALAPENPDVLIAQASIYGDAGDVERLEGVLRKLEAVAPERSDTLYFRATAAFLSDRGEDAVRLAEQVLAQDARHARAYNLLGAAQAGLAQLDAARRAFQASAEINPRDPTPYVNLGSLELMQAANASAAANYFGEALSIDPTSTVAREGLAQSLDALGLRERARRVRAGAPNS